MELSNLIDERIELELKLIDCLNRHISEFQKKTGIRVNAIHVGFHILPISDTDKSAVSDLRVGLTFNTADTSIEIK